MAGLSLIVAIGAQNAFVLRQGLMGAHVFAVSLACSLSDAALIALGVTSFRQMAVAAPWFVPAMRYGGAAFLIWYGARNLYSALRSSEALAAGDAALREPHADFGDVSRADLAQSSRLSRHGHVARSDLDPISRSRRRLSLLGAMTGSFLFFFALGYGAMWLRPIFASPVSWRALEALVALTMWTIAFKLIMGL